MGKARYRSSRSGGLEARDDEPFLEWGWDGSRLRARTDRYALHPVFYWAQGNQIIIGDSMLEVLHQSKDVQLNHAALAVFLRFNSFLAEDTPFLNIHCLPPGGVLSWTNGLIEISRLRILPAGETQKASSIIDSYIDLFRASMKARIYDHEYVMPLSGGRDSRHILLEAVALGRSPAYTVTMSNGAGNDSNDIEIAGEIANALSLEHRVLQFNGSFYESERIKNRRTNFASEKHAWLLPLADHLGGEGVAIFDGLGGDVLTGRILLTAELLAAFRAHDGLAAGNQMLGSEGKPTTEEFLHRDIVDKCSRQVALERMMAEIELYFDLPDPVSAFVFFSRTRRAIAACPLALYPKDVDTRFPYLDKELFALLMSVEAEYKLKFNIQDLSIAKSLGAKWGERFATPRRVGSGADYYRRRMLISIFVALLNYPRGELLRRGYFVEQAWRFMTGRGMRISRLRMLAYLLQLEEVIRCVRRGW